MAEVWIVAFLFGYAAGVIATLMVAETVRDWSRPDPEE